MQYIGAVSDADILIHLAKVERLDILELLFYEVVIPQFVYSEEIKKKAGRCHGVIYQAIHKDNSIFKIKDRKKDRTIELLAKDVIKDKRMVIGPGESECAGYAQALRIPIIISDNSTEFKWLADEFITLTYYNILSLCVYFKKITKDEAEGIFNRINTGLTYPTKDTFEDKDKKFFKKIRLNGWKKYLLK